MSTLLERVGNAANSGVYRTGRPAEFLAGMRGGAVPVMRIDFSGAGSKEAALGRIASALSFPDWFGGNWDALEDCLSDLSWLGDRGCVLLLEGAQGLPADERGILGDVLASAASYWKERGRPFVAVFAGGETQLPEI